MKKFALLNFSIFFLISAFNQANAASQCFNYVNESELTENEIRHESYFCGDDGWCYACGNAVRKKEYCKNGQYITSYKNSKDQSRYSEEDIYLCDHGKWSGKLADRAKTFEDVLLGRAQYFCRPQTKPASDRATLKLKNGEYLICGHQDNEGCNNRTTVYSDVKKMFYVCDSSGLNRWRNLPEKDIKEFPDYTLISTQKGVDILDCYNRKCAMIFDDLWPSTKAGRMVVGGFVEHSKLDEICTTSGGTYDRNTGCQCDSQNGLDQLNWAACECKDKSKCMTKAGNNTTGSTNQSSSTKSVDKTSTESTQSGCVNTVGQRECKDGEHKGYFVCESDDDCLINKTLPAHAIDGHCVSAGRNGYKICTATDCNDGWIAKGGWCQKDTISTQEEGKEPAAENEEAPGTEKVEKEPEIAPETPMDAEKDVETENDCPEGKWNETENTCDCGENATWNTEHKKCERIKTETIQILDAKQTTELNKTEEFPQLQKPTENSVLPQVPNLDDESAKLEEKLKTAKDELSKAQDKENSWANRAVSATSTAASGVGGMMTASALAERAADKDAEAEMQEYISTMKCEYGKEQQFNFGADEITLPGGNELLEYYTEYKTLADNLKTTKAALGLRPGIESEVLYDRAQSGLYQYSGATRQTGGETSLFRALTDESGADAAAWADQKDKTKTKLTAGGVTAGVGVIGGATGNYFINRDKKEKDTKK